MGAGGGGTTVTYSDGYREIIPEGGKSSYTGGGTLTGISNNLGTWGDAGGGRGLQPTSGGGYSPPSQVTDMSQWYRDTQAAQGYKPTADQVSAATQSYREYVAGKTNPNSGLVWNQYGEVIGNTGTGTGGYTDFSWQGANAYVDPNRIWNADARSNPSYQRVATGTPLTGIYLNYDTGQWEQAPEEYRAGPPGFLDHSQLDTLVANYLKDNPTSLWDEESLKQAWANKYQDISAIPSMMEKYSHEFANNIKPITSLTPLGTPSVHNALKEGTMLKDWVKLARVGDALWNPDDKTVSIGGNVFPVGSIPGTSWNAEQNRHFVTDEGALMRALGMEPAPTYNPPIAPPPENNPYNQLALEQQRIIEELFAPRPSWEEEYARMAGMMPQYESLPILSFNEALSRAQSDLGPLYQKSLNSLIGKLASDQIRRGFYGQLPADAFTSEAVAQLEADKNADMTKLAHAFVDQSMDRSMQQEGLNIQRSNQNLEMILNTIRNAQQSEESRRRLLMDMLNRMDRSREFELTYGLDRDRYELEKDRDTWDREQSVLSRDNQALTNALARTETMGYVTTEADAKVLGVPVGTPSWQAKYNVMSLNARGSGGGGGGTTRSDDGFTDQLIEMELAVSRGELTPSQALTNAQVLYKYGRIDDSQYEMIRRALLKSSSPLDTWSSSHTTGKKVTVGGLDYQVPGGPTYLKKR